MRRAVAWVFAIASSPGCLCLQTPDQPHDRASGAGGDGGAAVTSASSSAGAESGGASTHVGDGGSGGFAPPPPCAGFSVDGEVVTLAEDDDAGDDAPPALVALDDTVVGVAYARDVGGAGAMMQLARIGPWDAWPPGEAGLTTVAEHKLPLAVSSVAVGASTSPEALSLLYRASEGGLYAALRVDAHTVGASDPIDAADQALFIRPGAAPGSLVGHARSVFDPAFGTVFALGLAIDGDGSVPFRVSTAGCATTPIAADAAPTSSGVLLAAALGQPLSLVPHGRCSDVAPTIGPARSVSLASVAKLGAAIQMGATIDAGAPVERLALAGRSDGAWLAIGAGGAVRLGRVDADGLVAAAPADVAAPVPADAGSLGLAPIGDAVAIALAGGDATTGSAIAVGVRRDADGGVAWAPLIGSPTVDPGAPIALLASTNQRFVLVAWSAPSTGGRRVHLARLRCIASP